MKGDVWSAGVCLYYMLYQCFPFYADNVDQLYDNVMRKQLDLNPNLNVKRSEAVKDLLKHMLEKDENKRYDWNQVAQHVCISGKNNNQNPLINSVNTNQIINIKFNQQEEDDNDEDDNQDDD
ncbi:protein kinase, putative [Ichthyophthirius multifiliis]|uniref:Protein kinase, putative n=1 Tax=Ichthyophthirius multifiliis TaxID=5932 RepID=G0R2L2_ICHMU|nr:protein kinase, putative [Ichthyophthirius multifiliis]EGR28276.1 protein kinase, putative [Ichthyophthirius multifiliis]|eukprot:XP_004027621.1 protein kinase, putative [Ichthyophthirius multifiliis]